MAKHTANRVKPAPRNREMALWSGVASDWMATAETTWCGMTSEQDSDEHEMALIGRIIEVWPSLPEHIKLAVEALCLQPVCCEK